MYKSTSESAGFGVVVAHCCHGNKDTQPVLFPLTIIHPMGLLHKFTKHKFFTIMKKRRTLSLLLVLALQGIATALAPPSSRPELSACSSTTIKESQHWRFRHRAFSFRTTIWQHRAAAAIMTTNGTFSAPLGTRPICPRVHDPSPSYPTADD
jgi:hypothetical protein